MGQICCSGLVLSISHQTSAAKDVCNFGLKIAILLSEELVCRGLLAVEILRKGPVSDIVQDLKYSFDSLSRGIRGCELCHLGSGHEVQHSERGHLEGNSHIVLLELNGIQKVRGVAIGVERNLFVIDDIIGHAADGVLQGSLAVRAGGLPSRTRG
jgi:hypothetical protein